MIRIIINPLTAEITSLSSDTRIRSLCQTDSEIYAFNSEVYLSRFYWDKQNPLFCSVTGVNDLQCLGPKMAKEDSTVYNLKVERPSLKFEILLP